MYPLCHHFGTGSTKICLKILHFQSFALQQEPDCPLLLYFLHDIYNLSLPYNDWTGPEPRQLSVLPVSSVQGFNLLAICHAL